MKRLKCWLRGHRWQEVRVVKDIELFGTDQRGEVAYVAKTAEWQVQCERCGEASGLNFRDLAATQLLPKDTP